MGVLDVLKDKAPQLALMLLSGRQGGLPAQSGLLHGFNVRRELDERDAHYNREQALREQQLQFQQDNATADNTRMDEELQRRKFADVLAMIERATQQQAATATDPTQAENAIMGQAAAGAQVLGLPPDQLTGMVPSMAPVISGKQKKQANELLANIERQPVYKASVGTPEFETQIVQFNGEGIPIGRLREIAGTNLQAPDGQPMKKPRDMRVVDGQAVDFNALEPGQKGQAAAKDNEPLVAIMGPDGAPVLVPRSQAVGKHPASTREQGRPVMSSDANRITELDVSLNDLGRLEQALGTTGAASKIGAMLPNVVTEYTGIGEDAKKRQAVIDQVKQIIGKALEGGVLRKEDEYKYVKILPTIGDPPPVATAKLANLRTAIEQRRDITIQNLKDANFDTSKFETRGSGAKADPLGIR
jgi:hypothetical protein